VGCTSELSHKGQQFLSALFERFDKDRDGALSPAEVRNLFSTCPVPMWGPDVHRTVPTNSKVLNFIITFLYHNTVV
jgi:Ras family protein T1